MHVPSLSLPGLRGTGDRLQRVFARLRTRVDGYPPALSGAFVFLLLFIVYLATATYHGVQSPDPPSAAIPAWQLATHGNLTLDAFEGVMPWFVESGERIVSNRTPGVIFFGVPFFFLFGAAEGPTVTPAAVAAATAAAGAMLLLHLALRRLVAPSTAMAAAFVAGLATSTWSVSADALWAHGPNQLWLTAAMLALAVERYWSTGVAFGLAVFTRPHLAVVAAIAGIWTAVRRRSWRPLVFVGIPASVGLLALMYYNSLAFPAESPLGGGYGGRPLDNLVSRPWWHYGEDIAGMLVSPDRGLLVLSPFLLALLPGLRAAWRSAPGWVRTSAVGGLAYMLVQLRISYYPGGVHVFSGGHNFFSYRLSIEFLTLAAPLLVLCYREWTARSRTRQRLFTALVLLSVAIQGFGAVYYRVEYVERSPWTNFKLWEALQNAGPGLVALVILVAVVVWTMLSLPDEGHDPRGVATSSKTPVGSGHPEGRADRGD